MPEPTPGQEPTKPEADPKATQPVPETKPTPEPEEKFDRAYVESLRKESADHRKKLAALEARIKTEDDAKLSEIDKAKKEAADVAALLTEAQSALRKAKITRSVEKTAAKMNLDADLASELVKESMLNIGEDGEPTDTEAVLKGLLKKWPYLAKPTTPAAGINAGDGKGTATPPNDPKAREQELRAKYKF